ncbi:hypothetical protein MKW98_012209 [Papaver atlanticum]|uniref:Uncharacterized protein n=1 Tax=Papaver atlanticum TaxID=357466 RepID=A0AAD4XLZ6_9MAGN|nr:hypothetical protein MKW98_012209 [Papaver atlanticum]
MEKLLDNLFEKAPVGTMNKITQLEPQSSPHPFKPVDVSEIFDVSDVKSTFVSSIAISAKELYAQLNQKSLPKKCKVFLSSNHISISSLVNSPADKINVMVETGVPISFGIRGKSLMMWLKIIAEGDEICPLYVAYQPVENLLILAAGGAKNIIKTFPYMNMSEHVNLLCGALENKTELRV